MTNKHRMNLVDFGIPLDSVVEKKDRKALGINNDGTITVDFDNPNKNILAWQIALTSPVNWTEYHVKALSGVWEDGAEAGQAVAAAIGRMEKSHPAFGRAVRETQENQFNAIEGNEYNPWAWDLVNAAVRSGATAPESSQKAKAGGGGYTPPGEPPSSGARTLNDDTHMNRARSGLKASVNPGEDFDIHASKVNQAVRFVMDGGLPNISIAAEKYGLTGRNGGLNSFQIALTEKVANAAEGVFGLITNNDALRTIAAEFSSMRAPQQHTQKQQQQFDEPPC